MIELTLITSVLNSVACVDAMLASVPVDSAVEHVIIDAGSSDGTLDRLSRFSHIRLMQQPGIPLYDAWNDALALARGRYVLFLNADDLLAPDAIVEVLHALRQNRDVDVFCGDAEAFVTSEDGVQKTVWHYRGDVLTGARPITLIFGAPIINAKVFRRDLFIEMGCFDASFAFAADREFLLRLVFSGRSISWRHIAAPLYRYRIHAGSKTLQQSAARRTEISLEHQRLANRYLCQESVSLGHLRMLRAWLTHEIAISAFHGLATRQYLLASSALARLVLRAPLSVTELATARRDRRSYRTALQSATHGPEQPLEKEAV